MTKIFILIWKNLLVRKNHLIQTALELLIPIALVIVINIFVPKPSEETPDNDLISFDKYEDKSCINRLGLYGNIIYEPSTPFTNTLMSKAACYAGYKKANVRPGNLNDNSSYFNIGVKFELNNRSSNIPDILSYTLYPTNTLWVHLKTLWKHEGPAVPKYSILTMYNIIELQRAIDASFLFMKNITANKITLENTDVTAQASGLLVPLLYITILMEILLLIPAVLNGAIRDKDTGAKELMLMMGVKKIDIWIARFIDVYVFQILVVIGIIVFSYVPLKESSLVFEHNYIELWGIMMFGLIGCIINLFFLSCLFQSYVIAMNVIGFLWLITYLGNNYLMEADKIPGSVLYLTCLLPHTAFLNAVFLWGQFTKFGKPVSLTENISGKGLLLYEVLLIMLFNIGINGLLTWYFENVKPGKFGIPKPYNFFLKKSYRGSNTVNAFQPISTSNENTGYFEAVPANIKVSISIQNVSKIFKRGIGEGVVAVDNLSLNFYENEINGLLGHNGAGKTTVFSMITGLTFPTSGKIFINGFDVATQTNKARRSLGLCPQKDMLIEDLNAMEILKFYGMLKGLSLKGAEKEAVELIETLKLKGSQYTKSSKLSGGQKRKVSLAIALIGGSQILILDEPTSGMDAEIRREIWELLLNYRKKKTILLTTHFMEEADVLCDRIAIMDSGKLKCHGGSMFLKSKFGKGYVLSVVINDSGKVKDLSGKFTNRTFAEQGEKLVKYVKQSVPSANLKSQNIRTFTFELPESSVDSFPNLLSGLEKRQSENEIAAFSINVASLEEVFLSLRSGQDEFDKTGAPLPTAFEMREEPNLIKISGVALIFQQIWTLFVKKWIIFRKSIIMFIILTILPAALIVCMAFFSDNKHSSDSEADGNKNKSLSYSLSIYEPSIVLYANRDEPDLKGAFEKYIEGFGVTAKETLDMTGTIYQTFKKDYFEYSRLLNLGVEFLQNEIKIYHNKKAVHMVPVSLNIIHNFLLNFTKQSSSIVTTVDAEFVDRDKYFLSSEITQKCTISDVLYYGGMHSYFYIIGPVKENNYGSKELQLMVTPATLYWLTHLIWDFLCFFAFIVTMYLIMGFTQETDSMLQDWAYVIIGYSLWIIGLLLICYVISSFLRNPTAAFSSKFIIYSVFTFLINFLITEDIISDVFQYLHPSCILLQAFKNFSQNKNDFVLNLFLYDLILFCFLLLKDSKILGFVLHKAISKVAPINYSILETKEQLVRQDEMQVEAIVSGKRLKDYALVAKELRRWYFKFVKLQPAVRGVSFFVKKGECFGLLGVNGAGKTSTFKMLTGEIASSTGNIYIGSRKLSLLFKQKYLSSIGYCPQSGGLIPMFTGKEMLIFFARMRGIRNSNVKDQVQKWLMKFGISELAKKRWETYSGGNQRKISAAVSMIGDSPLVFLDEPTTGVDPVSRRSIWNLISELQRNGQCVILTSHSMDECEALCSRVAIMVKGRFRCIGETTTLKDKYGQGYSVRIKVSTTATPENMNSLKKVVLQNFSDAELVDEHLTTLQYKISNKYSAAEVFRKLTEFKKNNSFVESYSASAATLEQIFIGFARE